MITYDNGLFTLSTAHTTYCFRVLPSGHLEHLYYGDKITIDATMLNAVCQKHAFISGNLISYSKQYPNLGLENNCLEYSTLGKGDLREPFIKITHADGSTTSDFTFEGYRIIEGKPSLSTLPSSYDKTNALQTLEVTLIDSEANIRLILNYSVFNDCDVITRSCKLDNCSDKPIILNRIMSMMLDFDESNYLFSTFTGAWSREMNLTSQYCKQGKLINSSSCGVSSNRHNPFVILSKDGTTEDGGACYGFNLIYSGNHYECAEVSSFNQLRFVCGINPEGFNYKLESGEAFESPEAVMTFSSNGFAEMSHHMHDFIKNHIVRGEWQYKERPILINSWEAAYFDINEKKLIQMAKAASEVGIELFVMDDGWFGERNDDTSSLGDWTVNTKKLPNGLEGLAKKINELGMAFGIWVEPEMVSENSTCYKLHPEWALKIPNRAHSEGRNQMLLDLTNKEVREYIIDAMSQIFSTPGISYVKWDMNRVFSDYYSSNLSSSSQGELCHRYILGLYEILEKLTTKFPHILFESCCSGGNRFDLGMLCYMPQIWASDNTDAICRASIQTGYSYGYPMSVLGAHVSACPNHQTLRETPLETRFNVAAFGLLGYECPIGELPKEEKLAIKAQVELYKKYRRTLQFGDYYRIDNTTQSVRLTNYHPQHLQNHYKWITVSKDKTQAVGLYLQTQVVPNFGYGNFITKGLDNTKVYTFKNRSLKYNVKAFGDLINTAAPIHIKKDSLLHHAISKIVKMDGEIEDYTVTGSVLNHVGIRLKQGFEGTGYNEEVRFFPDYASRIYLIDEC